MEVDVLEAPCTADVVGVSVLEDGNDGEEKDDEEE